MNMTCHRCGAPIAQGQRFCNSCGAQQNQPAAVTPKFCVSCGHPLTPGSAFCNNCGAAVDAGSRHQVPAIARPVQAPQPSAVEPVPFTEVSVPASPTTTVEAPAAQDIAVPPNDALPVITAPDATVESAPSTPNEPAAFQTVVIPTSAAPVATPQIAPAPMTPVQTPAFYANVPATTTQVQATKGGKGCLMAVVITL